MNDDEELLDLVDANDKVIGTIRHADAPSLLDTKAGYIRGSISFIQNEKGQLWIPKRTADKKVAPSGLDFGVAEHVQSGETYLQAVIRGFKEELLLDVQAADLEELGVLKPVAIKPYFFTGIFRYRAGSVDRYNKEDFTGFEWLYPKQVVELIEKGTPAKNALKAAILEFLL